MLETDSNNPLSKPLVIVGPTASGKSALALAAAQLVGGCELISADAMAVYKEMNIGTAKPSLEDQAKVRHHVINVVSVSEDFTVSEFQRLAEQALNDLASRSQSSVIVGGTGLYVKSVVDDFTMPPQFPEIRAKLDAEDDVGKLWRKLNELDSVAAAKMEPTNHRRVARALEVCLGSGKPFSSFGPGVDNYPPVGFCQVGLEIDRVELDRRIDQRYDTQLEQGLLAEVESLAQLEMSRSAGQALGYKELFQHVKGELTFAEAIEEARLRTKRFARRQQRWFRRDPRIKWFDAFAPDLASQVTDYWHQQQ